MISESDARQGRHRLALAARRDDDHLLGRQTLEVARPYENPRGCFEISHLPGHLRGRDHARSDERHPPLVGDREIDDLLDPVDVAREGADDDPARRFEEEAVERLADPPLRPGEPFHLRVRAVREEGQDPLVAVEGERLEVEAPGIDRGLIDLEIAGVDQRPGGRPDRQGQRGRDAVGHLDELDAEGAERHLVPRADALQLSLVRQSVLPELASREAEREVGAVDRHAHLVVEIRQGADVVLVAVGQDDRPDLVLVLQEVTEIRDHDVDAVDLLLGEHEPGVDDDRLAAVTVFAAVDAELSQAAERDDLDGLSGVAGGLAFAAGRHGKNYMP